MFYKFNLTDALLFISAFASLVYSEILFLMVMKIKPFYRPVGTINTLLWNILTSNKRNKMTDFIPYFAGIITVLFGVAFAYALTNTGKKDDESCRKKLKTVRK
jgi:predicted nucleotide-binding protein (sugar kinase/HSP70/actin superfamily)